MTQVAPHSGRHAWQSSRAADGRPLRPRVPGVSDVPGVPDDLADESATPTAPRRRRPGNGGPPSSAPVTGLQRHSARPRGRHATSYGQNYPRVVGWTVLGSLIPGVGLLAAGRRTSGTIALTLASLLASAAATYIVIGDPGSTLAVLVTDPTRFLVLAGALILLLVLWVAMVLGTHSALRRYSHLGTGQRVVSGLLITSLIALVAIPTAKAGSYALIFRDTVTGIFTSSGSTTEGGARPKQGGGDPWADHPRVNVLLIGSDAGADRIGIRPDTLILASIDTRTGDTVLFSLPRNLEKVPFPPGTRQAADNPQGRFECYDANGNAQCLLNAMWTFGEENWQRYYSDEPSAYDAGRRATFDAVEQVTGLRVDQYAMLNLRGFMQFVDAIGGIRLNVYQRLPIGGSSENRNPTAWIEPGRNRLLNGYESLWFARSRWSTDDYDRMRRQRCVIGAVIDQADPAKVALAFPDIAKAAKENISTGIPLGELDAWVQLTLRVKQGNVRSLPFTSSVVNTVHPDYVEIRQLVADALDPTPAASPSPTPSAGLPSPAPSAGDPTPRTTPSAIDPEQAKQAQDIRAVC